MQQNTQQLSPPDPELIYTDRAEYNRQLAAYMQAMQQQTFQQLGMPFINNAAETSLHLARNGKYKEVWEKWEPEIMQELSVIPRTNWNIQLLDKAAQLVRSNHIDEIVRVEAERMAGNLRQGAPAVEGGSTGFDGTRNDSGSGRPLDQLFADNDPSIRALKESGLTPTDIRQRFKAMGTTEEEYVEGLKNSGIIHSGRYTQAEAKAY
jgi:hypothetical protein